MRLFFRFCLITFTLVSTILVSYAQSYYFNHYQAEDGLANNNVITIFQDRKGLIWLGTKGGLNSFDGYSFKSYKNKRNRFGTIGNNSITSICEDLNGILWIGTGRGIFKYDQVREVFTELTLDSEMGISHIMVDKSNNLWFLADRTLYNYKQQSQKIIKTRIGGTCAAFDANKQLWIGRDNGSLIHYDPVTKSSFTTQIVTKDVSSNLRDITQILQADNDMLLIGTAEQGLKIYNLKTHKIKSLLQRNIDNTEIFVRDIVAGDSTHYWIATESGIFIYNIKTNEYQHLIKRPGDNYSLSDNAVYSLCRDKHGDMWAGTYFGGLNYYSVENARFRKYYPVQGENSIAGSAVREICSDKYYHIWIGTEDAGLSRFDLKTGLFKNYNTTPGGGSGISYPNIHGLLAVDDKLYLGPFFRGLEVFNINTGKVSERFRLVGGKTNDASNFVMCIYLTSDSTILLGTTGRSPGLYTYDPKTKQISRTEGSPERSYVLAILQDHEGTIWTGSLVRGAFYFNRKTKVKGNISFSEKVNGKLTNDYQIQGIYEDSNHVIWFTTEGGGLIKLQPDRKSFKKFTTHDGLPTNNLFRILEDRNKNIWISSQKGLICMNLQTEKMKNYTQSDGLLTNQFNYNSAFKDEKGTMYFGSVKGLISFDPEKFNRSAYASPIYITGFQINNQEVIPDKLNSPLKKSIMYTDSILLSYDQSNFDIEFAALNYASPKVTRYRYIMKGLDNQWTYLSSNRRAYFTDLSPGEYTFTVTAANTDGRWTGTEKKLFIKIAPPFWKSNLAYLLYIILTGSAFWICTRYYHNYIKKQNLNRLLLFEHEKEKEIYEAKIEFFTNIAHEIQTPLTLITGPLERVIKKIDELPSISRSLRMMEKNSNRLLELTTQLLDFRKTEVNQFGLNFVNVDVAQLLNEQVAVFKQDAIKKGIKLYADLPRKSQVAFIDKEAFKKISSNLISNAVKYASSKATVSLEYFNTNDDNFVIKFINDGKAIPNEFNVKIFEPFFRVKGSGQPGTGVGLSLAKSLTELHNGSLKLISGQTDMIVFELKLPIHQQFEFKLSKWKNI